MLNQVPASANYAVRQVTLRHPNSFDAVVSRKVVKRIEADANGDPSESAGAPTLGGMGVLRSEDEAEFEYVELGPAKVMRAAPFGGGDMIDHGNATMAEGAMVVCIESVADPEKPGYFTVQKTDLVMIVLGPGVVMAYDAANADSPVGLGPYQRRYVLNPRDDLSYVEPFED